ncbi:unnamed protein product, partial [marine sediment metagenome]
MKNTYENIGNKYANVLVTILLLGSLWGFLSEIILKSAVFSQGFPFMGGMAGYITAIGIGMMGIAFGNLRKPSLLMGVPLVAIPPRSIARLEFTLATVGVLKIDNTHSLPKIATKENLGCFEALTGTGTCENMPRDKYMEFMIEQNQSYPMHQNSDILVKYYDKV